MLSRNAGSQRGSGLGEGSQVGSSDGYKLVKTQSKQLTQAPPAPVKKQLNALEEWRSTEGEMRTSSGFINIFKKRSAFKKKT